MRLGVFDALFWQRPKPRGRVDLIPLHASNFAEALSRQDQELQRRPERRAELLRLRPQCSELVIVKHAVARRLGGRRSDAVDRRRLDEFSLDGPGEEALEMRPDAVRKDRSRTVEDAVEQLVDVSARDLRKPPPLPGNEDLAAQQALGFARRLQRLDVPSDELFDGGLDEIICRGPSSGFLDLLVSGGI
jgi:hypothetical protein